MSDSRGKANCGCYYHLCDHDLALPPITYHNKREIIEELRPELDRLVAKLNANPNNQSLYSWAADVVNGMIVIKIL